VPGAGRRADGPLPHRVSWQPLGRASGAACRRLLRVLLLRHGAVSADSTRAARAPKDVNASEASVLRDKINDSVKTAMKAQDKPRLSTLRLINAAIKNADIEAERAGKRSAHSEILDLRTKMVRQCQ